MKKLLSFILAPVLLLSLFSCTAYVHESEPPASPAGSSQAPVSSENAAALAPVTPEPVTPEPATPEPATPAPATPEPVTPEPATPEPATPAPATPEPATPAPVTPEPATPKPTAPKPAYPDLSLRERADDSFFSDTAILGNSLVDGLRLYAGLKTVDYYCATSMSVVSALYTQDVLLQDGTYGTQLDAIAQKQYGKVYIQLGINEIGNSVDYFIGNYRAMLNQIRASQPNADIYIMALTPTSESKNGTSFSKDRVLMYNEAL